MESNMSNRNEVSKPRPQDWTLFGGEEGGHSITADADIQRFNIRRANKLIFWGITLIIFGMFAPQHVGEMAGTTEAKIRNAIDGALEKRALAPTPAPNLNQLASVLPNRNFDPSQVPTNDAVAKMVTEHGAQMQSTDWMARVPGKELADCISDQKITQLWTDAVEFNARCLVSVDKTRIWQWGFMQTNDGLNGQPYLVLTRKLGTVIESRNVLLSNTLPVKGLKPQRTEMIPRFIAEDFPELKIGD
jgi:hypothetical protein